MKKFKGIVCGLMSAVMVLGAVCVVRPREVGAEERLVIMIMFRKLT